MITAIVVLFDRIIIFEGIFIDIWILSVCFVPLTFSFSAKLTYRHILCK